MALQYTSVLSSDMLISDIEEHTEWFGQVIRSALFPEEAGVTSVDIPNALVNWCEKEAENIGIENSTAEQLKRLHFELDSEAKSFLEKARSGQKPSLDDYDAIEHRLTAYIEQLSRLKDDVSGVNISLDPVTGLRSVSGMKNDIKRELDRRERKGNPFCICEIEIDKVSELSTLYDRRMMDSVYRNIGNMLLKSIRSFDDAYHLGRGDYLLVLKHIDIIDACSVMDRMRDEISKLGIDIEGSFEPLYITASFGVIEPVPGDNIDDVLKNVRNAVKEAQAMGGNQVIQWKEQSALQQYATDVTSFE